MRKILFLLMTVFILFPGTDFQYSQESTPAREELSALEDVTTTYEPAGRRDPFKNLLAGKEIKEKFAPGEMPPLSIDDINLIGIVKHKKKYTAILSSPQGFPYYLGVGDKLSDGFILSISDIQVIFRKTSERGIPLTKTKDIVKEINPEER